MADDTLKSTTGAEVPDVSPGAGFQVFVDMANLHNKLKLLNYDDEYVMKWRMKSISRIHFAIPMNPGDQLHAFIALSAWLFQKSGIRFDKPSEVFLYKIIIIHVLTVSFFFLYFINRTMIKVYFFRTSLHSLKD